MKWKLPRPCPLNNSFLFKDMVRALALLSLFVSCGQNFNTNTFDAKAFGSGTVEAALADSFAILQDKCMSCHNYHQQWQTYRTSAQWVAAGRVIPGNAFASDLITRMKNFGGDMPLEGDSLSSDEADVIRQWINAL